MRAANSWIGAPSTGRSSTTMMKSKSAWPRNPRKSLAASGVFKEPIVTEIVEFTNFYPAEEYHQDYSRKNPLRYKYYRWNSGRDQFLEKVWGAKAEDPADPPGRQFYQTQ